MEGYHNGFKWDLEHAHRTDLNPDHITEQISPEAVARIVSTRIRVARNLGAPFVMNPNGNGESRVAVLNMVRQVTDSLDEELRGTLYAHATMTAEEEQRLIDDHFLFKGRDMRQAACGYHQFWPQGRGIFQSRDKLFNMWINEGLGCPSHFLNASPALPYMYFAVVAVCCSRRSFAHHGASSRG